ncbi:MAG: tRNA pseudouridine(55) synthase TruB [Heliobacteriaceae bacterium]|jgi:tRNA pseudouridine55 synthase|nr:tRNA pseudouridine(55) synthase TruB [Heliobacteriaceae bacterium]
MELFGFLNIYKPPGITSHDVVARLRRALKIKQIGHTGTLDPFAEGVLPIAVGKATRLIEFLADDKEYIATVQFGKATTTYDIEGEVTFESSREVSEAEIIEALKDFQGEILQIPPMYSAIKVNGKKLYDYARKGQTVQVEPRKVVVEVSTYQPINLSTQEVQLLVKCSKGTYIRSIAHDLGQKLGVGAHLIKLVRTRAGKFTVDSAIEIPPSPLIKGGFRLINPLEALDLPQYILSSEELEKIKHGQYLFNKVYKDGDFLVLTYNDNIVAVGTVQENKILTKKVFV